MSSCKICGNEFQGKKGGRAKEYCSSNCRDVFKFQSALDKALSKVDFKNMDYVRPIKGDLFRMVNNMPKPNSF